MRRILINSFSAAIVLAGGLHLATAPAAAASGAQATCGPVSGECCVHEDGRCACGPCSVIFPN